MVDDSDSLKLYWVEEQEIYQKLYGAIFTSGCPVKVVNNSPYGEFEAIRTNFSKDRPDILLIGCNSVSLELLRELTGLRSAFPTVGIILLPAALKYEDLRLIQPLLDSIKSSFGFLFKKSLARTEQIFNLITLVKMGQVVIDPQLVSLISTEKDKAHVAGDLTAREMEILNLVAKGYTNVAISEDLCIDIKTVRHHINNMYSKLKTIDEFDNRHPRVSATNVYHRLTGQLSFNDSVVAE